MSGWGVSVSPANADPSKVSINLSQALWHPSDLSVKPIMVNRKTDKATEPMLDANTHPFDALPASEFLKLSQDKLEGLLEGFFGRIISSIGSSTTLGEK